MQTAPPRPEDLASRPDVEVLFPEARRRERRRRLAISVVGVVVVAGAVGLSTIGGRNHPGDAAGSAGGSSHRGGGNGGSRQHVGAVTSVGLTGTYYNQFVTSGRELELSSSGTCQLARVNPVTLRLRQISAVSAGCYGGFSTPQPSIPSGAVGTEIVQTQPRIGAPSATGASLRLLGRGGKSGPVILRFPSSCSWCSPVVTYGGGRLWIYAPASQTGPKLLQLSARTGKIEDVVPMPDLVGVTFVADSSGLWITQSTYYSDAGKSLYHVASGGRRVVAIRNFDGAIDWMTSLDGTLWVGVEPPRLRAMPRLRHQ
jgi:hypothetical protein